VFQGIGVEEVETSCAIAVELWRKVRRHRFKDKLHHPPGTELLGSLESLKELERVRGGSFGRNDFPISA
jgi:hypothetical protein